jgi:hypothetical protein
MLSKQNRTYSRERHCISASTDFTLPHSIIEQPVGKEYSEAQEARDFVPFVVQEKNDVNEN